MFSTFLKNHVLYEIMWKHILETDTPHVTVWRMRIVCCVPKATNAHSEYVIVITVIPRLTSDPANEFFG